MIKEQKLSKQGKPLCLPNGKPLRSDAGDISFHALMLEDVCNLEYCNAYLTPDGWVMPPWLKELRVEVEKRDGHPPGSQSMDDTAI